MPCFWPREAWRRKSGVVTFREPPDQEKERYLRIPCGGCIGCRVRQARDWAIRCQLELSEHESAAWVTLTYDDDHLPPTLVKSHLSSYLKRLRSRVSPALVRFFGVGEYGDKTERPHYHTIIYGLPPDHRALTAAWHFGHVHADKVTPANIAYTAGYAQKKIRSVPRGVSREYVDPDTGECFEWQQPFRLCSRRPGIGAGARRHARSFRTSAIFSGREVPAPRYLHDAWRAIASASDIETLDLEKLSKITARGPRERLAGEAHALAKYNLQAEKRKL